MFVFDILTCSPWIYFRMIFRNIRFLFQTRILYLIETRLTCRKHVRGLDSNRWFTYFSATPRRWACIMCEKANYIILRTASMMAIRRINLLAPNNVYIYTPIHVVSLFVVLLYIYISYSIVVEWFFFFLIGVDRHNILESQLDCRCKCNNIQLLFH